MGHFVLRHIFSHQCCTTRLLQTPIRCGLLGKTLNSDHHAPHVQSNVLSLGERFVSLLYRNIEVFSSLDPSISSGLVKRSATWAIFGEKIARDSRSHVLGYCILLFRPLLVQFFIISFFVCFNMQGPTTNRVSQVPSFYFCSNMQDTLFRETAGLVLTSGMRRNAGQDRVRVPSQRPQPAQGRGGPNFLHRPPDFRLQAHDLDPRALPKELRVQVHLL